VIEQSAWRQSGTGTRLVPRLRGHLQSARWHSLNLLKSVQSIPW